MTAGSGLIHSELPEQDEGLMEGFQLWLNLPAARKMTAPSYRDIPSPSIPESVSADGARVRVIAGAYDGVNGAVQRPDTEPLFLDIHLPAGREFRQSLLPTHNAFVYTYRGIAGIEGTEVPDRHMAILANAGDGIIVQALQDSRFLLIAGRPLAEPIVQHGPFVMNTPEQIHQAVRDYQAGRFSAVSVQSL
jgi:redox-sensitive bicupin YhaK (pirin superfamily)